MQQEKKIPLFSVMYAIDRATIVKQLYGGGAELANCVVTNLNGNRRRRKVALIKIICAVLGGCKRKLQG